MVLLKNANHTLPLLPPAGSTAPKYQRVAVIGPAANDSVLLLGNYHGLPATTAPALADGGSAATPLMALLHRLQHGGAGVALATGDDGPAAPAAADASVGVLGDGGGGGGGSDGGATVPPAPTVTYAPGLPVVVGDGSWEFGCVGVLRTRGAGVCVGWVLRSCW